jgi:mono/diheme cytochrome c family protein
MASGCRFVHLRIKSGCLTHMTKRLPLRLSSFVLPLLFFVLLSASAQAQDIPSTPEAVKLGEALFKENCKTCHKVHEKFTGPALAGVDTRRPAKWIIDWVHNPAKMISSGDEYANKIYAEFNKSQMTPFTFLKDQEILSIIAYVKDEAGKPAVAATTQTTDATAGSGGGGVPAAYLDAILVGMVIILVLLVIILALIINALRKFLDQRDLTPEDREVVTAPFTFSSVSRSPGFIFFVIFIVGAIAFKTVIDGLFSIGVQQGYQPKQPIAFSHKIHAGQYEIECKYCHTGAMKGKQANIPTTNICMNCHAQIKSGAVTGAGEIAKIYSAAGFNPDTQTYSGKTKPVEWIRIHNLPDLAYFNHSQHVNVAGVVCQTCHGPIQEMDVVRQYSLLTMGWCIDCHRKTDVNSKGNAYYDKLMELHNNKAFKVEEIGGLECSKCHY